MQIHASIPTVYACMWCHISHTEDTENLNPVEDGQRDNNPYIEPNRQSFTTSHNPAQPIEVILKNIHYMTPSLKIVFIILTLTASTSHNSSSSVSSVSRDRPIAAIDDLVVTVMADDMVETLERLLRSSDKKKATLRLSLADKTIQDLDQLDVYQKGTNCTSLVSNFSVQIAAIKDKYKAFNNSFAKVTVAAKDLKSQFPEEYKKLKPQIDQLYDDSDDLEIESDSVVSKLSAIIELCHKIIDSNSKTAKSQELLALECEVQHSQIELNKKAAAAQDAEAKARQREMELKEEESKRAASAPTPPTASTSNPVQLKLFKSEMDKFSGDFRQWQSFWDKFEVNIHNNQSVPTIMKFTVLKDHLSGDALKLIDNFALTENNYVEVFNMLQSRYGNKQVIAQLHYKAIQDLQPATMDPSSLDYTQSTLECIMLYS